MMYYNNTDRNFYVEGGIALQSTEPERMTISVEEAASHLGIGRNLAYELARRGELPGAIRLGRRILVSKKALETFLAGHFNHGISE